MEKEFGQVTAVQIMGMRTKFIELYVKAMVNTTETKAKYEGFKTAMEIIFTKAELDDLIQEAMEEFHGAK